MKALLILIVLVVVGGFGGKFFLEKRYEDQLDNAIAYAGSFARVRYENINIGFDGSIEIRDLRITPAQYDDTITVDSIVVNSSDPMMPIRGADIFKDGEFPDMFEVKVKRLALDARRLDKLNQYPECRSLFGAIKYSNAGYDRYDGDLRFKMDFSNVYESKVYVDAFDQASTTTIEISMDASQVVDVFTQNEPVPVTEIIYAAELNEDAAQGFTDYCANLFKVSTETYLNKVVASSKFSENSFGVDLGPDLRQALAKFMRGGSRFEIESRPSEQLKNLSQAEFFKPNDVLGWMNMTVLLDGETIPVKIPELTAAEQDALDKKNSPPVVKKKEYVAVPAIRSADFIGRKVRIKRTGDKAMIKGRMSGFNDNRIAVDVYRHAGEMTLNVPLSDVAKFEVLE